MATSTVRSSGSAYPVSAELHFAIDGGGTHTRLAIQQHKEQTLTVLGSINPVSTGVREATTNLQSLLDEVARRAEGQAISGCVASATVSQSTIHSERQRLVNASLRSGLVGQILLTNDIVPLVFAPPLCGVGIAVIVGTGSGYVGRARDGTIAQAGGYEYVISDEGSAFALGLAGLKAAARAHDGRGSATVLLDHAERVYGYSVPGLGAWLARQKSPKPVIAHFAPQVCEAWVEGDNTAAEIVSVAIEDLCTGVEAVRKELAPNRLDNVLIVGGVPDGCKPFRDALVSSLHARGARRCYVKADGLAAALAIARDPAIVPESDRHRLIEMEIAPAGHLEGAD